MLDPKIKCLDRLAIEIQARLEKINTRPEVLQTLFKLITGYQEMLKRGQWLGIRIDQGEPSRKPLPKPEMRTMLRPIGDIVIWTDTRGDELLMVFIRDVLSAWIAGCSVTLVHIDMEDTDDEILCLLQKGWEVEGWEKNTFRVVRQDKLKAFKGNTEYATCQALVVDFVDRERMKETQGLVRQWDKVVPCYENKRAASLSLFLPCIPEHEQKELLKKTIEFFRGNHPYVFHPGAMILCPVEVAGDWFGKLGESLGVWNVEVRKAEELTQCFQQERNHSKSLSGCLCLVPYDELGECHQLIKYLPETRAIQVFGADIAEQKTERLMDEAERKASLLSLGCFPDYEDLFILPAQALPSCGDLGLNEQVQEMLWVSRFMRPVCFQQVPDEYLPQELMRSKRN